MSWDTNNTAIAGDPNSNGSSTTDNVQNVMTHEFGHWLFLDDIKDANCNYVTMYGYIGLGEINKITLDVADKDAVSWQYP
jgi:hypothetical protein